MTAIKISPVARMRRKINSNHRTKSHKLWFTLVLGAIHHDGL